MNILINYADRGYINSQKRNSDTGLRYGFNVVWNYNRHHLSVDFKKENEKILSHPKGAGYWLWKPAIILDALNKANDNDIIFYCDSGSFFINDITPIIDLTTKNDITLFNVPPHNIPDKHYAYKWTKRDVFIAMRCDNNKAYYSEQILGGFQVYRKCDKTIEFITNLLKWSCMDDLITDAPSKSPNLQGFKSHRHDQSILTLFANKMEIKTYRDPSQYGNNFINCYEGKYPQIIELTRDKR